MCRRMEFSGAVSERKGGVLLYAQQYIRTYPEEIKGVILIDPLYASLGLLMKVKLLSSRRI